MSNSIFSQNQSCMAAASAVEQREQSETSYDEAKRIWDAYWLDYVVNVLNTTPQELAQSKQKSI